MTRFSRPVLVVVTVGAMLLPAAAQAGRPGASCGNSTSAINQYCENLPSSTGRGTPAPGAPQPAPTLQTALPRSAARAIERLPAAKRRRARKLLSIPAPAARAPLTAAITARHSAWSFPVWVMIVLLAIAAAGVAAVLARRRGHQAD